MVYRGRVVHAPTFTVHVCAQVAAETARRGGWYASIAPTADRRAIPDRKTASSQQTGSNGS
jgi:hypothetical protein